jgi:hypothetical protein
MLNFSCKECGSPIDRESGLPNIVDPCVVDLVRAFFRDLQIDKAPLSYRQRLETEELHRLLGGC